MHAASSRGSSGHVGQGWTTMQLVRVAVVVAAVALFVSDPGFAVGLSSAASRGGGGARRKAPRVSQHVAAVALAKASEPFGPAVRLSPSPNQRRRKQDVSPNGGSSDPQTPDVEVCTPLIQPAADFYSDVYSYRMRTPDLAARVAVILLPAGDDISSSSAADVILCRDLDAAWDTVTLANHQSTDGSLWVETPFHAEPEHRVAAKSVMKQANRDESRARGYPSRLGGMDRLPTSLLPHGKPVSRTVLELATDVLREAGYADIDVAGRVLRRTAGGDGQHESPDHMAAAARDWGDAQLRLRRELFAATPAEQLKADLQLDGRDAGGVALRFFGLRSHEDSERPGRSVAYNGYGVVVRTSQKPLSSRRGGVGGKPTGLCRRVHMSAVMGPVANDGASSPGAVSLHDADRELIAAVHEWLGW